MSFNVTRLAKPHSKEKSNKNYIVTQCSDQWRKDLDLSLSNSNNSPGRVQTYVHWHLHNKHKRSVYKPALNLTHQSSSYRLELLRIRSQHTIHIIHSHQPSHLHYAFCNPRADYQDRVLPYCQCHARYHDTE